ncbi:DUF4402 domain-containing protein [Chitinophaga sp.]|uniref:DUF4402 domain-containing protein n=1 Tax=Chitinophaga sp. TaxID=1869181 RepID=UPI0031DE4BDB
MNGFITGILFLMGVLAALPSRAQQPPPRPIAIYVNPAQGLRFGAFTMGASGGTVTVFSDGSRSSTGSVVLLQMGVSFAPAIFEVDANPGTLIQIVNGSSALLTGSNGGTLTMTIGASSTGSPFIATATPPARTLVRIGGTLTVGNILANPPGQYSGTFNVTFIQE